MDFLVYSRGSTRAAVTEDDPALNEAHWSYMDGFADAMTARGPTLASDRETWTGSLHVVDLPSADAARTFVEREPFHRAGMYAEHGIWGFRDLLGRSMWQFAGRPGEPLFLVIAVSPDGLRPCVAVADLAPPLRACLVVYGELRSIEDETPAGVALALQAPSRDAAVSLLREGGSGLEGQPGLEILDWEFGGRR
jgi:uncharacterized protein YciI